MVLLSRFNFSFSLTLSWFCGLALVCNAGLQQSYYLLERHFNEPLKEEAVCGISVYT